MTTVRRVLPRNGIATVDSGAHRILQSQVWEAYEPRTLLQSTGLCTMGGALPLAIGAKLAEPERPVVVFTGDAGLEMVLASWRRCGTSDSASPSSSSSTPRSRSSS